MPENYLMIKSRSPFSVQYVYVDTPEHVADSLFESFELPVRFYGEYIKPESEYVVVRCRISRKNVHRFESIMNQLARKMRIIGHSDYDEYCAAIFSPLDAEDEMPTASDMEHCRATIDNLTLYLDYVQEHAPELFAEMDEHFDGMPGYGP